MTASRWIRLGGFAGIVFLLLDNVGQNMLDANAPARDASIPTLAAYYAAHHHQVTFDVIILAVAAFALIWFVAALHQMLREDGRGDDPVPALVLVTGSVATGLFLLERIPHLLLATMANQPGGLTNDLTVRALWDLPDLLTSGVFMAASAFVLAISFGLVHRGAVGAWFAGLGVISAILLLIAGLGGYADALDVVFFPAIAGLAIVILVTSVRMIRGYPEPTPAARSIPATAGL